MNYSLYVFGMRLNFPNVTFRLGDLNSHLDRHENIGKGKLGKKVFERIVNDPRLKNIPMVLETPCSEANSNIYAKEIALLYSLCK